MLFFHNFYHSHPVGQCQWPISLSVELNDDNHCSQFIKSFRSIKWCTTVSNFIFVITGDEEESRCESGRCRRHDCGECDLHSGPCAHHHLWPLTAAVDRHTARSEVDGNVVDVITTESVEQSIMTSPQTKHSVLREGLQVWVIRTSSIERNPIVLLITTISNTMF